MIEQIIIVKYWRKDSENGLILYNTSRSLFCNGTYGDDYWIL